jgi:hypothetical protein
LGIKKVGQLNGYNVYKDAYTYYYLSDSESGSLYIFKKGNNVDDEIIIEIYDNPQSTMVFTDVFPINKARDEWKMLLRKGFERINA